MARSPLAELVTLSRDPDIAVMCRAFCSKHGVSSLSQLWTDHREAFLLLHEAATDLNNQMENQDEDQ